MISYGKTRIPSLQFQDRLFSTNDNFESKAKQHHSFWGILTAFTFLGELVVAAIPGIGEVAAAALGIEVAAEAGEVAEGAEAVEAGANVAKNTWKASEKLKLGFAVGSQIAGASARTAISAYGEHMINPISVTIDFASALLPFVGAGISNYRMAKRASSEIIDSVLKNAHDKSLDIIDALKVKLDPKLDVTYNWDSFKDWAERSIVRDIKKEHVEYNREYQRIVVNYRKASRFYQSRFKEAVKINAGNLKIARKELKQLQNAQDILKQRTEVQLKRLKNKINKRRHWEKVWLERKNANSVARRRLYQKRRMQHWNDLYNTRAKHFTASKKLGTDTVKNLMERYQKLGAKQYVEQLKNTLDKNPFRLNRNFRLKQITDVRETIENNYDYMQGNIFKMSSNWKSDITSHVGDIDTAVKHFISTTVDGNIGKMNTLRDLRDKFISKVEDIKSIPNDLEKFQDYTANKVSGFARYNYKNKIYLGRVKRINSEYYQAHIIDKISEKLANITPSFKTSKGYIISQLKEVGFENLRSGLREDLRKILFLPTKLQARYLLKKGFKESLTKWVSNLTGDNKTLALSLFESMGKLKEKDIRKNFTAVSKMFMEDAPQEVDNLTNQFEKQSEYYYGSTKTSERLKRKFQGMSSSNKFRYWNKNGWKVSKIWFWINPLTAARAIPDSIYQTIKGKLDKYLNKLVEIETKNVTERYMTLEEKALNQAAKDWTNRDIRSTGFDMRNSKAWIAQDAADKAAFKEAGGIPVPPNRYLMGFRILPDIVDEKAQRMLIFYFNRIYTSAATPHLHSGKKPVLGWATDYDIEQLTTIGVSYFWQVGKRKNWYISRGGRKVSAEASSELGHDISLFLGFLNVNALRNFIPLITSTEYEAVRWANGKNEFHLTSKMLSTMVRTGLNRVGRLTSRFLVGYGSAKAISGFRGLDRLYIGAAKSKFESESKQLWETLSKEGKSTYIAEMRRNISKYIGIQTIGREVQRYSSAILASGVRQGYKGNLKFGFEGSRTSTYLTRAAIGTVTRQAFTGRRSFRYGRSSEATQFNPWGKETSFRYKSAYQTSFIKQIRSNRRQLGIIRRVTGVYPRSLPGGYRVGQIKLK